MSLWVAIILTLLASSMMNMGLVLLKKAMPAETATNGPPRKRLHSPVWALGIVLLLSGYGVYMAATSARAAPISLLQPIFAFGLVVVAVMAVLLLKEHFGGLEWFGIVVQLIGVVLLGASAEESASQWATIYLPQFLAFLGATAILWLIVFAFVKSPQHLVNRELLFGVLAGLLLGVGYLATKAFTLAWHEERIGRSLLSLAGIGIGLVGGLAALQWGYRHGRALIVTAVNQVVNQVLVIAGGLFCLGERFPREPVHLYARVAGLAAILVGTLVLARFSAAGKEARPAHSPT